MLFNVFESFGSKEIFLCGKISTCFNHCALKLSVLFCRKPSEEMESLHAVSPTNPTSLAWFHFAEVVVETSVVRRLAGVAVATELLAGTQA